MVETNWPVYCFSAPWAELYPRELTFWADGAAKEGETFWCSRREFGGTTVVRLIAHADIAKGDRLAIDTKKAAHPEE